MGPSAFPLPLHADPTDQPPPLTGVQFLTGWTWDWWVVVPLALMVGLYLWGVRRLAVRGDHWSAGKTTAWCLGGGGSIAVATLSVLGTYDTVLFSVHMVQHMLLTMIAPVMMAVGAPITLLLRNLGAVGKRRVVAVLHSWPLKVLMFPPFGTALMLAYPYALYMTPLYPLSLRDDLVHNLVHVWLVFVGCIYFWPLLGTDPMPNRIPHALRMLLIMITMPSHAFLGVTIMGAQSLIAEDWYLAFNRSWPPSPIDDQYLAGAIMWATGDLTMGVIMGVFFYQWYTDSKREAIRVDRQLDREERLAAAAAAAAVQRPEPRVHSEYHAVQTPGPPPDEEDR